MSRFKQRVNPLTNAVQAKGPLALLDRVCLIWRRYGLTPRRMERALDILVQTLKPFECGATLPTTAFILQRRPRALMSYHSQGIEFIVHGYQHIDYTAITPEAQRAHLQRAQQIFAAMGIYPKGFRSPYLRRQPALYAALRDAGFIYVSNQPVLWHALDLAALSVVARVRYERAVTYYAPWDADKRVSTPRLVDGLVEIPVSLPDDEILLDRLHSTPNGLILEAWTAMLAESYRRGELLTLQLHPERSVWCAPALAETLRRARALTPTIWIARLDEIAAWWKARDTANITIAAQDSDTFRVIVNGPSDLTLLARGVVADAPTTPWIGDYQRVMTHDLTIRAARRPCIGVSATTAPALVAFLREQGYLVETVADADGCALYLHRPTFTPDEEVMILTEIEAQQPPLIRLGRWPRGQHSALAVTGDIDALTWWDYVLRFVAVARVVRKGR